MGGKLSPIVPVSHLLDAIAGVPNACEPLPGIVTGGQPAPAHLAALKQAGCAVVIDIREPMEPQPYRTPDAVDAARLEYRRLHRVRCPGRLRDRNSTRPNYSHMSISYSVFWFIKWTLG